MRLLNTNSFELETFYGDDIPKYAILSHRWENEEISLQELQQKSNQEKAGWKKVQQFCYHAQRYEYQYAWIDTCCIDKTSSSELQEAINSMFAWYRNADVCCAYLNDVSLAFVMKGESYSRSAGFENSAWFTRGWTLQELLAPRKLWFVNSDWKVMGSREVLADSISEITGIPAHYVREFSGSTVSIPHNHSGIPGVAEVMSWASGRVTTRIEDTAYSLMGLFGVQMPLLYGEGRNAFLRLQLEILKMSDDESIFAWCVNRSSENVFGSGGSGLLAPSPAAFAGCKYETLPPSTMFDPERPPFWMTNKGLRIEPLLAKVPENELPGLQSEGLKNENLFQMPLHCFYLEDSTSCAVIYLQRIDRDQFRRVGLKKIVAHKLSGDKSHFERTLVKFTTQGRLQPRCRRYFRKRRRPSLFLLAMSNFEVYRETGKGSGFRLSGDDWANEANMACIVATLKVSIPSQSRFRKANIVGAEPLAGTCSPNRSPPRPDEQ